MTRAIKLAWARFWLLTCRCEWCMVTWTVTGPFIRRHVEPPGDGCIHLQQVVAKGETECGRPHVYLFDPDTRCRCGAEV